MREDAGAYYAWVDSLAGREAFIRDGSRELWYPVEILETSRNRHGRMVAKVRPTVGVGEVWVWAVKLFTKDRPDEAYIPGMSRTLDPQN